ncbi:hypothetical protein NDU88_010243 [Pleurodeles waltl]|uniref:Uncharacterized protein n=1 Tax=Pleurodeles waltl TaxID=8319 RepID=A0AAV7QTX2_PLEWA|nr:hypothetical protein NDU88_010243 [Pleurodeles waltl]
MDRGELRPETDDVATPISDIDSSIQLVSDLHDVQLLMSLDDDRRAIEDIRADLGISEKIERTTSFKPRSKFTPAHTHSNIELFAKRVSLDLHHTLNTRIYNWRQVNNLLTTERAALRNLKNDQSIVIREADKGGRPVLSLPASGTYLVPRDRSLFDLCCGSWIAAEFFGIRDQRPALNTRALLRPFRPLFNQPPHTLLPHGR